MQIDIGFGDVIVPAPTEVEYPTPLEFPAPVLLAYPKETAIAEKLAALTKLGLLNSRMKDYDDVRAPRDENRSRADWTHRGLLR